MPAERISQSLSPFPQPDGQVSFPAAITGIIAGKRITKVEWDNTSSYCMLRDGKLMMHRDDKWFKWIINDGDLMGEDWIILE